MADILRFDTRLNDEPSLFARIGAAIADYRKYRETLDELNAMTDRELLDLNLSRHAIRAVAREAVYGR